MPKQLPIQYKPVQLSLPVHTEHLIDKNDSVVSFLEVVGGLNLSRYIKTSKKGRQQYSPDRMLKLVLFGYMEKVYSVRELEKRCKTDIRFMYLADNQQPSFMAFERFIKDKLTKSIEDIFYEINEFLIDKENINTEILYIDGTKIEANANKFSFVWKKAIFNYQKKLFIKVTKAYQDYKRITTRALTLQETYHSLDLACPIFLLLEEMERRGVVKVSGKGHHKHPLQRLLDQLMEYQLKLREYEIHLEICGQRNSYSKVDPDATFMHGKEDYYNKTGIFKPYYNVQIGVSDGYILHLDLFDNPTDTKTFIPFMDSYDAHYGEYPLLPVADAGYESYDNYLYSLTKGMKLMMKYNTYSYEKTKKFQKNEFHIKNMRLVDNKLISESGEVYEYDHEYTSYKGQYPKHKTIYRHVPSENSSSEVPKTISRDVVLLEVQA